MSTANYRLSNPEAYLWSTAKTRAKKQGKEFTITKYDVKIPSVCPILGIPLVVDVGRGRRDDSPSLDRVDNEKGYVKGNVQVISWKANQMKGSGTLEEFERMVEYIRSNRQ